MADPTDPDSGEPVLQGQTPTSFPEAAASQNWGGCHPGETYSIRTPRNVGVRRHATLEARREPVLLSLIVLLAAAAGWILLERSNDLPPQKRYSGFELDIGSPTELPHYAPAFDAAGQLRVTDVEYSEDHGGTPDYFPHEGGIEAHIGVRFDRPVVGDASIQVVLELPTPVGPPYVPDCRPSSPIEPLELNCSVERLPEYAEYRDALVMRGILDGQSPPLAQDTVQSFGFTVHLSNIDGIGFRTSGSRVEASFPNVPAAEGADAVHVQYWIPSAGQMTWSGLPPIRVGEYVAEWRPRSDSWAVQSSASGIRGDLISMSNRYAFVVGVLLGIAGGALIASAQALLRSSATRVAPRTTE